MSFLQPRKPPPEARDLRTLLRQEYMKARYERTHQPAQSRTELEEFERQLKAGIQRVRRSYRETDHRSIDCGCWYPIYRADLDKEWDTDMLVRQKKFTWKRVLRKLGWDSYVSYERNFRDTLPWDDPRNRTMHVRIAKPNTVCINADHLISERRTQ